MIKYRVFFNSSAIIYLTTSILFLFVSCGKKSDEQKETESFQVEQPATASMQQEKTKETDHSNFKERNLDKLDTLKYFSSEEIVAQAGKSIYTTTDMDCFQSPSIGKVLSISSGQRIFLVQSSQKLFEVNDLGELWFLVSIPNFAQECFVLGVRPAFNFSSPARPNRIYCESFYEFPTGEKNIYMLESKLAIHEDRLSIDLENLSSDSPQTYESSRIRILSLSNSGIPRNYHSFYTKKEFRLTKESQSFVNSSLFDGIKFGLEAVHKLFDITKIKLAMALQEGKAAHSEGPRVQFIDFQAESSPLVSNVGECTSKEPLYWKKSMDF